MLGYIVYQAASIATTIAVPAVSYFGIRFLNDRVKAQRERLELELKEYESKQQQAQTQMKQEKWKQEDDWLREVANQAVIFSEQAYKKEVESSENISQQKEMINKKKLEDAISYILRNSSSLEIEVNEKVARDKIEIVIHQLNNKKGGE